MFVLSCSMLRSYRRYGLTNEIKITRQHHPLLLLARVLYLNLSQSTLPLTIICPQRPLWDYTPNSVYSHDYGTSILSLLFHLKLDIDTVRGWPPLHMYIISTKTSWILPTTIFLLAVALLCTVYRISLWIYVGRLPVIRQVWLITLLPVFAKPLHSWSLAIPDYMSILLDSLLWALKVHFPYPSLLGESNSPSRVSLSLNFSCSNFRQRSLYGFRSSTLIGWLGGDAFKYIPILLHRILRLIICKDWVFFLAGSTTPIQSLCHIPAFSWRWCVYSSLLTLLQRDLTRL